MGPNGDGSGVGVDDWPQNYRDRAGESLNLAANAAADVLYKLGRESGIAEAQPTMTQTPVKETSTPVPTETSPTPVKPIPSIKIDSKLGAILILVIILAILILPRGKGKKRRRK